jgi:hypothetical protein
MAMAILQFRREEQYASTISRFGQRHIYFQALPYLFHYYHLYAYSAKSSSITQLEGHY